MFKLLSFFYIYNRNHPCILYRFRDIASYLSIGADFDPPHLHLAPPQGVIPVELVELRLVTDGQTDGHRAMTSTADA